MPYPLFEGNCNTGISKRARYTIKRHNGEFAIFVTIITDDGDRLYPVTHKHPDLVRMVNAVKVEQHERGGGQFYINEFRQVIVPAGDPINYFYADEYHADLVFDVEGRQVSGKPIGENGQPLGPGDRWDGPHPGIAYILEAGGSDVRYEFQVSEIRFRRRKLSDIVGKTDAAKLARKIAAVKGDAGGVFYINEHRAMFAPVHQEDGWGYLFIADLGEVDPWFPKKRFLNPTPEQGGPVLTGDGHKRNPVEPKKHEEPSDLQI